MRKNFLTLLLSIGFVISNIMVCGAANSSGGVNRRCLAICSIYESDENWKINSVAGVASTFVSMGITSSTLVDYTLQDNTIRQSICSFFSNSDDDDVNYLYFVGHGGGSIGIWVGDFMYFSDIKQITDSIPGHFVIFFDACGSGGSIGRSDTNNTIEQSVIDNFFSSLTNDETYRKEQPRTFEDNSKYSIFCSCEQDEICYHGDDYINTTIRWMDALGYDIVNHATHAVFADQNVDGIVTAQELNDYVYSQMATTTLHPCYYSMYYFETIYTIDCPLGDVDMDEAIGMSDVLLLRKYMANIANLTNRQIELADISGDNSINMTDILYIQKYAAKVAL